MTQLHKHGYTHRLKTVTMYLPEAAIKDTLHLVRDHSATGSVLAFNYFPVSSPQVHNPNTRPARWGEPYIFGFPGEDATGYVKREGLLPASNTTGTGLWDKHGVHPDGSLFLRHRRT